MHMGMTAMSEKVLDAFAVAHPFLDVTGDVVPAWLNCGGLSRPEP